MSFGHFRNWHLETCPPILRMSVHQERPEVTGAANRRPNDPLRTLHVPEIYVKLWL